MVTSNTGNLFTQKTKQLQAMNKDSKLFNQTSLKSENQQK